MIRGCSKVRPPSVLRVMASWMLLVPPPRSYEPSTRASATATIVPLPVTAMPGMRTEAAVPS
jgi:hypothetical protein